MSGILQTKNITFKKGCDVMSDKIELRNISLEDIQKAPLHWNRVICEMKEYNGFFFTYAPILMHTDDMNGIKNKEYFGMELTRSLRIIAQLISICTSETRRYVKLQDIAYIRRNSDRIKTFDSIQKSCDIIESYLKDTKTAQPSIEGALTFMSPIEGYSTMLKKSVLPDHEEVTSPLHQEQEVSTIKSMIIKILTSETVLPLMIECLPMFTGSITMIPYEDTLDDGKLVLDLIDTDDMSISEFYFLLCRLYRKIEYGESFAPIRDLVKLQEGFNKILKGEKANIRELVSQLAHTSDF